MVKKIKSEADWMDNKAIRHLSEQPLDDEFLQDFEKILEESRSAKKEFSKMTKDMETFPHTREKTAALVHDVWSSWMHYLFSKCFPTGHGLTIPEECIERWSRQMDTPYSQLSEEEKKSDRSIADKFLNI